MNLYGLSAISNVNRARRQIGTGGFLASSTGGGGSVGANPYFDYSASAYRGGLEPGGMMRASPSQSGQPRSVYGVDFPVVGYPATGWDSSQRTNEQIIPGAGGEPQVITTQNIPPNDASRLPITSYYLNPQEFGGGPNAPTYGSPMPYPAPDMNIPPNEDVSPDLVNTFYGSTAFNGPRTRRAADVGAGYPDLSNAPPVIVNAPYGTASNPYPVPGLGGLPSTFGGGQSWQSNAARAGGGLSGSGYGSGRFAGPSVSFGYGGTMIGSTSGSIFGGNPSHGTILGY